MNWRDLLYFSKGERRVLTLLLCLITISWIILWLTDNKTIPAQDKHIETPASVPKTNNIAVKETMPVKPSKVSSERKKNFIRKELQIHSNETKKTSGRFSYQKTEKFPPGTIVELNTADTTILKKVPGIGSAFARRIIKYRNLLGGFYSVTQLREVYGIDEERYEAMKSWFSADSSLISPLDIHKVPIETFYRHPYINKQQAQIIVRLRKQKEKLSGWENFRLLEEFTETDKERLLPYLSFE